MLVAHPTTAMTKVVLVVSTLGQNRPTSSHASQALVYHVALLTGDSIHTFIRLSSFTHI